MQGNSRPTSLDSACVREREREGKEGGRGEREREREVIISIKDILSNRTSSMTSATTLPLVPGIIGYHTNRLRRKCP